MSIEEAMMGGIVFKGKKDKPKEENKVKTKAKKKTYITGLHGSGAAKKDQKIPNRYKIDIKNLKNSKIAGKSSSCSIFTTFRLNHPGRCAPWM